MLITFMAPYILVTMSFVEPQGDGRSHKEKKLSPLESVISRDVLSFDIEALDDLWTTTSTGESFTYPFFLSDGTIIDKAFINISEGCFSAEFTINDPFAKNFTLSPQEKRKATLSFRTTDGTHAQINWKNREIHHLDEKTLVTGTAKWPGGIEKNESNTFTFQSTLKCNSIADLKKELLTCLKDLKFYVDTVAGSATGVPKTMVSVPTLKELENFNELLTASLPSQSDLADPDEDRPISFSTPRMNLKSIVGFPDAVRKLQALSDEILSGAQREERELYGVHRRNILIFEGLEKESTSLVEALAGTLNAAHVSIQKYVTFTDTGFQDFLEGFISALEIQDDSLFVLEFPETRNIPADNAPAPDWKYSTGINPDFLYNVLDNSDAWKNVIIVFTIDDKDALHPDMKHHASMILSVTRGVKWLEDVIKNQISRLHERSGQKVEFEIRDSRELAESLWNEGCQSYADICTTLAKAVTMKASQSEEMTINQSFVLLAWEIISQKRK